MRAVEFITETPAAGNFRNRIWYHGTSKKNYAKILKAKIVKPFVSDSTEAESAIFLTSEPDVAREFGPIILAINNNDVKQFKVERWSSFPHGMLKDVGNQPRSYIMVIKEPVPLKYWKIYDYKIGKLK